MKYVAVMFDIVESRRYNDRYDVQNILMQSISYLNWAYRDAIKKEVVASAGDEFQGLFMNLQTAFLYIRKLQLLIYPIKIRCGIGYGEIKLRQSQMVRLIELVADIILPINIIEEDVRFYYFILENRMRLMKQENWHKASGRSMAIEEIDIDFEQLFEMRKNIKTKSCFDDTFYMEDFWIHGMSTFIGKVFNSSRQNIDRYVSLGRVKESRTTDKAIYEFLGENIW